MGAIEWLERRVNFWESSQFTLISYSLENTVVLFEFIRPRIREKIHPVTNNKLPGFEQRK